MYTLSCHVTNLGDSDTRSISQNTTAKRKMSSNYLNPPMCANVIDGIQCTNTADLVCSRCRLVQYCSVACQTANWSAHKKATCMNPLLAADWKPDWYKEHRTPFQSAPGTDHLVDDLWTLRIKKLWGNMPAIDILGVEKNEGDKAKSMDFKILCAASGDLRNVVKTVCGLPDGYGGKCTFVMNDFDLDIVARNIMLFLIAQHSESI